MCWRCKTALANIRNKQYRPYYAGRRDGKQGPEVFCAIEAFQMDECLPVTGKIETAGPCFNRLRSKVPLHVRNQLQQAPAGAASPRNQQKIKDISRQTANWIRLNAPLPFKELTSLASIVLDACDKGIPLTVNNLDTGSEGRFTVQMDIHSSALPANAGSRDLNTNLIKTVSELVGRYADWRAGERTSLIYQSNRSFSMLKGVQSATKVHLSRLEIQSYTGPDLTGKLIAAYATAIDNNQTPDIELQAIGDILERLHTSGKIKLKPPSNNTIADAYERYYRNLDDLTASYAQLPVFFQSAADVIGLYRALDRYNELLLQESLEAGFAVEDLSTLQKIQEIVPVILREHFSLGLTEIVGRKLIRDFRTGKEYHITRNFRIAPFGNRSGHRTGRFPHYHRRGPIDPRTGQVEYGQSVNRHRPWDSVKPQKGRPKESFWKRF